MLFCPDCGSILRPREDGKKVLLTCSCGYSSVEKEDILMRENVRGRKKVEVVDDVTKKAMPKTNIDCPKCEHKEAFFWTQQTRASDEAETQFFECTKCRHRWRSYN
tara:strand:- start:109 stop:426 length:318 start_codon:yes stop_codon:yes gene_type:complete